MDNRKPSDTITIGLVDALDSYIKELGKDALELSDSELQKIVNNLIKEFPEVDDGSLEDYTSTFVVSKHKVAHPNESLYNAHNKDGLEVSAYSKANKGVRDSDKATSENGDSDKDACGSDVAVEEDIKIVTDLSTAVNSMASNTRGPGRPWGSRLTSFEKQLIVALYLQGWPLNKIGNYCKVSVATIMKVINSPDNKEFIDNKLRNIMETAVDAYFKNTDNITASFNAMFSNLANDIKTNSMSTPQTVNALNTLTNAMLEMERIRMRREELELKKSSQQDDTSALGIIAEIVGSMGNTNYTDSDYMKEVSEMPSPIPPPTVE